MRVQLFDTNGNVLTGASVEGGATRFDVSAGQTVQVEFTYKNNGANSQSPGAPSTSSDAQPRSAAMPSPATIGGGRAVPDSATLRLPQELQHAQRGNRHGVSAQRARTQ